MSATRRLLVRGLWRRGARGRTVGLVVTLGIATAAFATLLTAWAILDRELTRGYAATVPAAATVWTDIVDRDLLRTVAAVDGVATVDARRVTSGRVRTDSLQWRPLQLIAPHDFANVVVSRFTPQQGAWPPAGGEVLVERDALQVARAGIGDSITVRTNAGVERSLRIAGTVHDPGQAQARMENAVYGYVSAETLAQFGEPAHPDRILFTVVDSEAAPARVRDVADRVAAALAAAGHPARRVELAEGHPHAALMGLLLLVQAGFGGFILLLGGLVAMHLFTAQMAAQVRQIGVLGALGANRGRIARIHLAEAALLGVVAFAVAWPAGAAGGHALADFLAVYLNFDLASRAVPAWVVQSQAVVAVVLPLLAAAWPVWRGSGVTVRAALGEHGGEGAANRWLARVGSGGLSRILLLPLRNGLRRPTRTAATLILLAAGGTCFVGALDLRASLVGALDRLFATRRYDLTLSLAGLQPFAAVQQAAQATDGVGAVEGWVATRATLVPTEGVAPPAPTPAPHPAAGLMLHGHGGGTTPRGDSFTVLAPPATTFLHAPDIALGRGLRPDDEPEVIVVNDGLAARLGGDVVGRELRLQMGPQQKVWRVVGVAREPFTPATGYIPIAYFERAGHAGTVNTIRLTLTRKGGAEAAVLAELERNLEQARVRVTARQATGDGRFAFDQHFVMLYDCLLTIGGLVLVVGAAGLASALGLALLERRREFGILHAIGATPRQVALLVVAEGCGIAVAGWSLSVLLRGPLGRSACDLLVGQMFRTRLEFVTAPGAAWWWLGLCLAIGAVASLLPARRAGRLTVAQALARA